MARESVRLAFVAALQHLPPRQRAVLLLCEVLRWQATEVAELLETSVASVNSALQRARATLGEQTLDAVEPVHALDESDRELLGRYVEAFERYDMEALTSLIQEDATQSMPPYDLWLSGRDDIFAGGSAPASAARAARDPDIRRQRLAGLRPVQAARGRRYDPGAPGARARGRHDRRAHVLPRDGALFPLFGLPPSIEPEAARRQHRRQAHERDELASSSEAFRRRT